MKVLLIQPPHFYGGTSYEPTHFPLGLAYIASSLVRAGHQVEVLDIWAHQYVQDEVLYQISTKCDSDIVGITALSTQYKYIKWLVENIKRYLDVKIIIGGPLATHSSQIVLNHTASDICVLGEGDITITEVLSNLSNLKDVEGIAFKDESGSIISTPPRPYIKDLDTIPFPAWDLFPMDIYLKYCRLKDFNLPSVIVVSSRGCPYNCTFCSKTFKGARFRSINNVVKEIHQLKKTYHIKGVQFSDELLLSTRERTYELCDKIKPLNIKWICQGRCNLVDFLLLKRMKEAGCVAVGYGVESGSQTILNNMRKGITAEQSKIAIKDTYKAGLTPIIQFMYGHPGETRETLEETVDFFRTIPYIGRITLSVTTVFPGTTLYKKALDEGYIKDEERYLEQLEGWGSTDYSSPLINFTDFATGEFYKIREEVENKIFRLYTRNYAKMYPFKFFRHYVVPYMFKHQKTLIGDLVRDGKMILGRQK
jgi:radical SAM superfamily enzyme YgiQ (UPF0313 family)